ncbi:MAG: hypothetical protein ABI321_10610 [Polyangia bacterium]
MHTKPVHIVETTLRDGGYEVDHQFTADDTAVIAAALEDAGFSYIEVCHGNGVGTHRWGPKFRQLPIAAATDEEHLRAARSVTKHAKYGVLLVAGRDFSGIDSIDDIAPLGVSFVRLALTPEVFADQSSWIPLVERIKHHGMIASINLMQTVVVPMQQVADGAKVAAKHGNDWFYVVDSFGGMQPAEVKAYIRAVGETSGSATGFHAHNNSGLAVANSLAAMESGATFVDSTLQGIGRATGNPATEVMVLALQQLGHELGIDSQSVLSLGDLARPLFAEKGNDPTYFVSGSAGIHSRALTSLRKAALDNKRDFRQLLLRVGSEAKRLALPARDAFSESVVAAAVQAVPERVARVATRPLVERLRDTTMRESGTDVTAQAAALFTRGLKARKASVLHLVDAARFPFSGVLAWESGDLVGVSVPVTKGAIPELVERLPEVVVYDASMAAWPSLPKGRRATLMLSFDAMMNDAAAGLVAALAAASPVWVPSESGVEAVCAALRARGCKLESADPAGTRVILTAGNPENAAALASKLHAGDRVVTTQVGAGRAAFVDLARAAQAVVLVPVLGPQIAATVYATLAATDLAAQASFGATPVGGAQIVGPYVAPGNGQIMVDSVVAPRRVIDAAAGSTLPFEELATLRATAILNGKAGL